MSHELSGPVGFANQNAAAKAMRAFGRHLLTDGIVTGCELTYNGGVSLSISAGYIMIAGGETHNVAAQTLVLTQNSGYARIILNVDTMKAATTSEFKQAFFEVDYAASLGGFSALTQQDINAGGTLYQVEFAVLQIGTGVLRQIGVSETAAGLRRPKVLWSGTWSSGSITVDGFSDYAIIAVECSDKKMALCDVDGATAANNGGYYRSPHSSHYPLAWYFTISISGDNLNLVECRWVDPSDGSHGDLHVTKIVGLVKKTDLQ